MKDKFIIIFILLILLGCSTIQKEKKDELANAIIECINSGDFFDNTIGVYQAKDYYEDYDLYCIVGFKGIIIGDNYPYKIETIKDKYVFFYSYEYESLPEDTVNMFIEKIGEYEGMSATAYYFMQCKTTNNNLLVRAINDYIEPYEIPEIRNFNCSDKSWQKNDIEIILNNFCLKGLNDHSIDFSNYAPINYIATLAIYNRTDSCLFFGLPEDSLGYFAIINKKDTLRLLAKSIYRYNYFNDDPNHIMDPERIAQFDIFWSNIDFSFFNNVTGDNSYSKLLKLLQDSLFYIPNVDKYSKLEKLNCIFPQKKIKVITPIEVIHPFNVSK